MSDPSDDYEYFRAVPRHLPLQDRPFFLTVVNDEASKPKHFWGLDFSTRQSAEEGAQALVSCGKYYAVFINEQVAGFRRDVGGKCSCG